MPIDDKNIKKTAKFGQETILFQLASIGASVADIEQMAWIAPYAGKIVSVDAYAVAITDADDGARLDLKNATTSVLTAAINPTAATVVAGVVATSAFVAGDKLALFATTGAGDALTGVSLTVVVRPLLEEEAPRV